MVSVSLAAGCAHSGTSTARARPPSPAAADPSVEIPAPIAFSDAESRRAEAIAEYATGVSTEITSGFDAALPHYENSLSLDPQNALLAVRLANIAMSRKEFPRAITLLENALATGPTDPAEVQFWLAVAYRATDQAPKAITVLRQALRQQPQHQNALQTLLEIYLQTDALADAAKLLDQAFRQPSIEAAYWTRLGDLYSVSLRQKPSLGKFVEAGRVRQCYEKALRLAPADAELLLRLGDVYSDSGNYERAADVYSKVLAQRPGMPRLREKLAFVYVQGQQKEKAVAILEEVVRREPSRYEIYNSLGELYEELDQHEKALNNYLQSLIINPNQLPPALHAALLQSRMGEYRDALATLTAAKDKFPTDYRISYFHGIVHNNQKEYGKALAAFADAETLASESPDDPKLDATFYFYFGAAAERAGDLDKAEQLFKKCLALDPEKDAAYNYLGYMWAEKGIRLDEAHELINKALALDPDNGAYIDSLGWVLYRLGRLDEAVAHLRRAAELVNDDATILDHLADALLQQGKRDEALAHLERAHKLDPNNKAVADKLQTLSADRTGTR
jgi:tetratricopeptide (TPR) repeat protein